MLEELLNNFRKEVIIQTTHGVKQGVIVAIDEQVNTVKLKYASQAYSTIRIDMIVSVDTISATASPSTVPPVPPAHLPPPPAQVIAPPIAVIQPIAISSAVLKKFVQIEAHYEAQLNQIQLSLIKPDMMKMPTDIKNLGYKVEQGIWLAVKNKYESALQLGRLAPHSDDLRTLIAKVKQLSESVHLCHSAVVHGYLGYFCYLNQQFMDSVRAYHKAALKSQQPTDWLNLAVAAVEQQEHSLAYRALEQLFKTAACTEPAYQKAWYKFIELSLQLNVYIGFNGLSERASFNAEQEKIFETICYILIKKQLTPLVEQQLTRILSGTMHQQVIPELLEALPKTTLAHVPITIMPPPILDAVKKDLYATPFDPNHTRDSELHKVGLKALLDKRFEHAEILFLKAVEKNINKPSAVRDLAMMYDRLDRAHEGIQLVEEHSDGSDADKNLLSQLYYKVGRYYEAIELQKELFQNYKKYIGTTRNYTTMIRNKEMQVNLQIANSYFKLADYDAAIRHYKVALKNNPGNYSVKRILALCSYQQGHKILAIKELENIVTQHGDKKAQELLDKIRTPAIGNGDVLTIDMLDNILDGILSSVALDRFTEYYLNLCNYKGVPPERVQEGKYIGNNSNIIKTDIDSLVGIATRLGTKNPEERSDYYLSAAKILRDVGSDNRLASNIYNYICRSFSSWSDSSGHKRHALDTIKTLYLEALKAYDSHFSPRIGVPDEQDAVNSLYRYLYAHIDWVALIPQLSARYIGDLANQIKLIEDSCIDVFTKHATSHNNYDKLFDGITIAVVRSPNYVKQRLLPILHADKNLRSETIAYLRSKGQSLDSVNVDLGSFIQHWDSIGNTFSFNEKNIFNRINIFSRFQLDSNWLIQATTELNKIRSEVFYELDRNYIDSLIILFSSCDKLRRASRYTDKVFNYESIELNAKKVLEEIETKPTKLAVEEIIPIVQQLSAVVDEYANGENGYEKNSCPVLEISSVVQIYQTKRDNPNEVDVQIKIKNTADGHTQQTNLHIEAQSNYYSLINNVLDYGQIDGEEQSVHFITLQLMEKALAASTFSLKLYATFRDRRSNEFKTEVQEIPIQLGDPSDFVGAVNKFEYYAQGGPVEDVDMFFGRKAIINDIYNTISKSNKSYVFYGQQRVGKSSILLHFEKKIEKENPNILVANLANIAGIITQYATTPLLYQMLYGILFRVEKAMLRRIGLGKSRLEMTFPTDREFYAHPTPLVYFRTILEAFKEKAAVLDDWKFVKIVVLIDEFTYLYKMIVEGHLDSEFMINWKALLQANPQPLFSAVLVAQDYYPKFKRLDSNAFQTMESTRVSHLLLEEARELIEEPIKIEGTGESRYANGEGGIERIYQLTAGNPYYIQILCSHLVTYINKERVMKITAAHVNRVMRSCLSELDRGVFENLMSDGDPSPDAIQTAASETVLREIARQTITERHCRMNLDGDPEKGQILQRLVQRDVLEQNEHGLYRIQVDLFKEWLNRNHSS